MSLLDAFKKQEVSPTQEYLDIAAIKDSMVVLKDGTLRTVLMCSALNFDLKTEEEQEIIVNQYQNFLNSLEFPIQIVVQSRPMDLGVYLDKLDVQFKREENTFLKTQIADYVDFLKEMIPQANIMDKKFYVIVPYYPPVIKAPTSWQEVISGRAHKKLSDNEFETYKKELIQKAGTIASGLGSIGLRCIQLNTRELIELFYSIYNPELATTEHLTQTEELESDVIKKGEDSAQ